VFRKNLPEQGTPEYFHIITVLSREYQIEPEDFFPMSQFQANGGGTTGEADGGSGASRGAGGGDGVGLETSGGDIGAAG